MTTQYLFYILFGYLSGSVLYGYLLPKYIKKIDVTKESPDQNPGVANAFLCAGAPIGFCALMLELLKGYLPVHAAMHVLNPRHLIFGLVLAAPLLNASGDLAEPGWARSLLPVYRRSDIRVSPMRIKEWDYYLITDGHVGLALTIADNGYMGLDSVSFLDFDEGWEQTKSSMRLFPMGKTGLPESSADGASEIARGGYAMAFYHEDGARRLSFHMDRFLDGDAIEGIVTLSGAPEESMVIATPFDKPGHFYYNQKINCMRATRSGWPGCGRCPGPRASSTGWAAWKRIR